MMTNVRTLVMKLSDLKPSEGSGLDATGSPSETSRAEPELELPIYEGTLILPGHRPALNPELAEMRSTRVASVDEWLGARAHWVEPSQCAEAAPPPQVLPIGRARALTVLVRRAAGRFREIPNALREASPARKALLLLTPFALVAALTVLAQPATSTTSPALPAPSSRLPTAAAAMPQVPEEAAKKPEPPAAVEAAPASVISENRAPAAKATLLRSAADALSEGNTAQALALYRRLESQKPTPASAAAIRILERRLTADLQQAQ